MIVVNLPVRDLLVSAEFYRGLGFRVDEEFCEEEAVSVRVAPGAVVMLLTHERYADFVGAAAVAGRAIAPALTSLSATGRDEVDAILDRALTHGGTPRAFVAQGPLYGRSFADPDGHVWELIHMPGTDAGPAAGPPPSPDASSRRAGPRTVAG